MEEQKPIINYEKIGHDCAWGVMKSIGKLIMFGLIIIFIINLFGLGTDSTDYSGWKRSGMSLHTDAQTGLQYLSIKNGTLIPRLNKDGQHISIKILYTFIFQKN